MEQDKYFVLLVPDASHHWSDTNLCKLQVSKASVLTHSSDMAGFGASSKLHHNDRVMVLMSNLPESVFLGIGRRQKGLNKEAPYTKARDGVLTQVLPPDFLSFLLTVYQNTWTRPRGPRVIIVSSHL